MAEPASVYISLLGPLDLRVGDSEARGIVTQPKRLAILVYLVLAAPAFIRRDRLISMFWPDLDQERARAALRDSLYHIRRSIGSDVIDARGTEEVRIDPRVMTSDVATFQAAAARGDDIAAAELYRGDLLDGFHLAGSPAFDDWLEAERGRLRAAAARVLSAIAADALGRDDYAESAKYYHRALDASPFDELMLFGLMESLEQAGNASAALAAADRFVRRLEDDLAIKPSLTLCRRVQLLKERMHATSSPPSTDASRESSRIAVLPPSPSESVVPMPPARVSWRRTVALVAGCIVVAAVAAAKFGAAPSRPRTTTQQIVVAPFTVRGDARIAYLGEGMVDLLVAKLDGAAGMHVIDPKAMLENLPPNSGTNDLETGRALSRRFGAQHFITGTVVQGGDALQISATLYDASGNVLRRSNRVAANDAALFPAIDDLARELLAGLLTKSDAPLGELAALTTSSYPALQRYLQGEQHFRAGAYAEAVSAFQQAIANDSMFALAHYRLSSAADWAGKADVAEKAARDAMQYRDRLPKSAAALVAARWEYWFGDARRAEEIYRELTASHPSDVEAWFESGEVLFHAGPWMGRSLADAEPAFRRALALDTSHIGAMMHLARVAAVKRNVLLLDSLLTRAMRIDPRHARTLEIRALRAAATGAIPAIDSVLARVAVDDDGDAINADAERVAVYTGNLEVAEKIARLGAGTGRARAARMIGLQSLAHILAGTGRWNEAEQQIEILSNLDAAVAAQLRANLVVMPFVHATAADIERARRELLSHATAGDASKPPANPHHFADAIHLYQLGMLEAAASRDASTYADQLGMKQADEDATTFRRSLAGSLRAHVLAARGDSAGALNVLQQTWLPPRKPLMIGWAWTHAHATDRLFLAQLLAHAGRDKDAAHWLDATLEDIAGSPVLLREAARVRTRLSAY